MRIFLFIQQQIGKIKQNHWIFLCLFSPVYDMRIHILFQPEQYFYGFVPPAQFPVCSCNIDKNYHFIIGQQPFQRSFHFNSIGFCHAQSFLQFFNNPCPVFIFPLFQYNSGKTAILGIQNISLCYGALESVSQLFQSLIVIIGNFTDNPAAYFHLLHFLSAGILQKRLSAAQTLCQCFHGFPIWQPRPVFNLGQISHRTDSKT